MVQPFQAVKVTEKVYWVGAIDWGLRNFHGYTTHRGSTYNAFLILADKVTLIDTVKAHFKDEMMGRIASIIDPQKIEVIVSNHSEMDHSGALVATAAEIKPDKIYASVNGKKALEAHLHAPLEITAVEDGGTVDLGNMKLSLYETRMIHWPDSMFSFLQEEGILFSQDGFGMHLATSERFDDELDPALLEYEAKNYFANILLPFSNPIKKLLGKMDQLNLPVKMIAPDHGPIWRKDMAKIVGLYKEWVEQRPAKRAVVLYDTMWQSTALMGRVIADGVKSGGAEVSVMPLESAERSDVITALMDAGALVIGAPTLNNNVFPSIMDVMTYVKGLAPKNLIGGTFSSYGWNGMASKQLRGLLEEMKVEIVGEEINVNYVPTDEDLQKCFSLGKLVAEELARRISS